MTKIKGEYTKVEILSQPDVWKATIQDIQREFEKIITFIENPFSKRYIVIGCGSTHYLSISAAYHLRKNGFNATAYPSSEFVFFSNSIDLQDSVIIMISRSGTTTETLWALEKVRKELSGSKIIVITVRPDSPLATKSDLVLAAPKADERSVAQTRSFTSMHICAQFLAEALQGDKREFSWLEGLPEMLRHLHKQYASLMEEIGKDLRIKRFFFLGGGPFYGLACEAMLKTKELALSWSEAYHPLELRHGPMSIVDEQSIVVGFISDKQQKAESQVMKDMKHIGARTLVVVDNIHKNSWSSMDYIVEIGSGLTELQRSILYLPLIQWLGFNHSLAKGFDPDIPKNLSQVIELSDSIPV